MSKEYTKEEVREHFLRHVNSLIEYWDRDDLDSVKTSRDRLEGLAFSIMVVLDGCAMALPGFIVAPFPHENDKEYAILEGDDYYAFNDEDLVKCDIAGSLHELLSTYR
jgi:hypothetical protein